jgi:SulP family sulfate permease
VRAPFASWLFSYRREWLAGDFVAGLTGAAVVIPKAMAYALIAGLSVEAGLYAVLAAMLAYPLLGSARLMCVNPSSALAMLTAAAIATASQTHAAEPGAIAATLTLLTGGVLLAASLLRLGFLANFLSLPVLVGFQAGVGIVIVVGQLKSLLGVHVESRTTLGTLLELPALLPQTHALTLLFGGAAIVLLLVSERLFPRGPIPLLLVAASIAASLVFGLEALGIATVAAVPPGLPALTPPDWSLAPALWPAALGVGLMAFTESIAAARSAWQRDDAPVGANRELLAAGVANAAAGMVGGLPVSGGISQTAIVARAGARSQLAQWVGAAAVLLTLLLLSGAIDALPEAALGAVLLVAGVGMVKPEQFAAIARVRRTELMWALATVAGVVLIGTLEGILIAVVLSVLTLMYQANHPPVYEVAYNREQRLFRRVGENEQDETLPGLLIVRTEGRLLFTNAANAGDKMRALVAQSNPRVIVLECSAIPDVEYTALVALADAEQRLQERGVTLWLAGVNPGLMPVLARSTLAVAHDPGRLFPNLHKALEAWERRAAVSGT